jgi:hypothetical protein
VGKNNARKPPAATGHHYLYSWVSKKSLPSRWAFKVIRQELGRMRADLIAEYGGDKVSPQAIILIDSVVEALGVQKLQGLYIRKAGIIRQDSLKAGNLELHSMLGRSWVAYANVVRQGLMALKELGGLHDERGLTPAELAEAINVEAAAKGQDAQDDAGASQEGARRPQDGRSGIGGMGTTGENE